MKILKLAILVIVVLGIVIGAFFLTSSSVDIPDKKVVSMAAQKRSEQISKDFSEATGWNQEYYERQANEIDQDEASKLISETDRKLLHEQLDNAATNRLYALMTEEFAKTDCSATTIGQLHEGVVFLKQRATADKRLATLEQCYRTYQEIRSYIGRNVSFATGFNGSSWKSLSDHRSTVTNKVSGYRNSSVYKQYLSNIAELKSGLSGMEAKANKAAAGYYSRLANEIYEYYYSSPESGSDNSQFSSVLERYSREAGQNSDYRKLYTLYRRKYE